MRFGKHLPHTSNADPSQLLPPSNGMGVRSLMTGEQSRLLKVGDRVCWGESTTDCGTVVKTSWSDVTIEWENGDTASIKHNDMITVQRVPTKLI